VANNHKLEFMMMLSTAKLMPVLVPVKKDEYSSVAPMIDFVILFIHVPLPSFYQFQY